MPFSHHSHSGQFCGHATNTLEEVVQDAIRKGITTFCMTEHIPRNHIDFYPGEANVHTEETLFQLYDAFYHEARRLQKEYADHVQLFVGFEGEWIRDASLDIIQRLLESYELDLFVGSVHHVHAFPIDYDTLSYYKARDIAGGSDEKLFMDYFDAQYGMLQALRPPVAGHFDLIRLKSDEPDRSFKTWPGVWEKVLRNLKFVAEYGGVVELNSSAVRKGMRYAYPQVEICKEFKSMGGRFTLSDDSHGAEQVGASYKRTLECIKESGIAELSYLAPTSETVEVHDRRFPNVGWKTVTIDEVDAHAFWKS